MADIYRNIDEVTSSSDRYQIEHTMKYELMWVNPFRGHFGPDTLI